VNSGLNLNGVLAQITALDMEFVTQTGIVTVTITLAEKVATKRDTAEVSIPTAQKHKVFLIKNYFS